MIKVQNIFFNNQLDFRIRSNGIILKDTEVLNLYFSDHCNKNCLRVIGNNLEWVPIIWMDYEKERLEKIKEINIISLLGDLTEFSLYCKIKFSTVKINYYQYNLFDQIKWIRGSLQKSDLVNVTHKQKKYITQTSVGQMRLNRYILLKFFLTRDINLYYPAVSKAQSQNFEYQISATTGQKSNGYIDIPSRRLSVSTNNSVSAIYFNREHFKFIQESFLNFVITFPNTNLLKFAHDEKYFDTILAKSVPFLLCEKNSNYNETKALGFLPYIGFNLTSDCNDNPVLRWQKLLEDNVELFLNKDKVEELYIKNKKIIEFNFNRLTQTDWVKEMQIQYNSLPTEIQQQIDLI